MGSHAKSLMDVLIDQQRKRRRLIGWLNGAVFGLVAVVDLGVAVSGVVDDLDVGVVLGVVGWCLLHIVGGIGFALGQRWSVLVLWPISIIDLIGFPFLTILGGYNLWVLYDTREQTATSPRALAIASAVPVVLLVLLLGQRFSSESPTSPFARQLLAAVEAQGGTREFNRWLSTLPSDTGDIEAAAFLLQQRGLVRLDMNDQLTYIRLVADGLTRLPTYDCAAFARGSATRQERVAFIERFDSSGLRQWFEVIARAMLAELRASPPAAVASDGDINEYVGFLYEPLPGPDRRRLDMALDSLAITSDEDACWFVRLAYGRALEPHPSRPRWLRVVASMGARSDQ